MHRIVGRPLLLVTWLVLHAAVGPASLAQEPPAAPGPSARGAGWLGVWLADAVDGGVQVVAVWPGGPADRSGIRSGDVLIEAAGGAVVDREDLARAVASRAVGEDLPVVVLRGPGEHRLVVRLGARSPGPEGAAVQGRVLDPAPAPRSIAVADAVGLEVEGMTAALRRYLGAPETAGVLVTRVAAGRVAERSGLRVGDVLVRLGDQDVSSAGQVRVTLVPWRLAEPLPALVVRERKPVQLELRAALAERSRAEASPEGRELLRGRIEAEIERLERRIAELRREIEELEPAD